ncbi:MAG: glycosyltransferase family 2 protein [Xenococcaceae cyanobacterium]
MKASVIIPVYKVEKYIAETINSVLNQTYQDFELIIVDDGSPDRSVEICQQFKDPRLKIIRQKNQGVCAARNTGISHATGQYLAFLDGDDLWLPQKLEKHLKHLESSPDVGVSFSRSAFIDECGAALGIYQMPKLTEITPPLILRRNPVGNGSAPVIRREVFEAIEYMENSTGIQRQCYFDPRLAHFEDVECWLRISLLTDWKTEGIPEALTLYRVNSKGASSNLNKQIEDLEKVLEKTKSYAPNLIEEHGEAAKAYEMRKLARWAVRLKAAPMAVSMAHRALSTYWKMIIEEPEKTLLTLAAAYSLYLLPQQIYNGIENLALQVTGASQKRRILQDRN